MTKRYRFIVLQCDQGVEDIIDPEYPVIKIDNYKTKPPFDNEALVIQCNSFHTRCDTDVFISYNEGSWRPTDYVTKLFCEAFVQNGYSTKIINTHDNFIVEVIPNYDTISVGVCLDHIRKDNINEIMNRLFSMVLRYEEEL